jgi:hypothetical protein
MKGNNMNPKEIANEFSFNVPVEPMPAMACIGEFKEVIEAYPIKNVYGTIKLKVAGLYGSRGIDTNFVYNPQWFEPSFSPREAFHAANPGEAFMMRKHLLNINDEISTLGALGGKYYGTLIASLRQVNDPKDVDEVADTLRDFFMLYRPLVTGFILKQQKDKTPEGEKVLTKYYEVAEWWRPFDDEGNLNPKPFERFAKRAEKKPGQFVIGYKPNLVPERIETQS